MNLHGVLEILGLRWDVRSLPHCSHADVDKKISTFGNSWPDQDFRPSQTVPNTFSTLLLFVDILLPIIICSNS